MQIGSQILSIAAHSLPVAAAVHGHGMTVQQMQVAMSL